MQATKAIRETRFFPLSTVGVTEHQQKIGTREWIHCPKGECNKAYVAAAVVNDLPEYERDLLGSGFNGWAVRRRLYCDHCNAIVVWHQACDQMGGRLGAEVGKHRFITNPLTINRFLRDHPQAAGVEQR